LFCVVFIVLFVYNLLFYLIIRKMAKIKQGILGGFSGSVANVVGSSWKGIAVMKAKPLSVANPKTAAQTSNRTQFSNVVAFASALLTGIIKPLLDRVAVQQSGYNLFVSLNKALFANPQPSAPEDLVISQGTVEGAQSLAGTTGPGGTQFTVNWDDNSGVGDALASDEAYVVIQDQNTDEIAVSSGEAVRSDGTVVITVSNTFGSTDNASVWLAFRRADGTRASDTSFYHFVE
jgi:hypothetical protein